MLLLSWIAYLIVGRICIYLVMEFPLPAKLQKINIINEAHKCDLCCGVYIYSLMSFAFHVSLLTAIGLSYIPVLSELITGGVTSFMVHLFLMGWEAKFNIVELK
jgi:hypothetical protein